MPDVLTLFWRTGRKTGRTIYAQVHEEPSDDDILIGMMDDYALAERVALDHNVLLLSKKTDYDN